MERRIVSFREDALAQWIAELSCGHAQHVRHEPPFTERPWTLTPEGRAARQGSPLDCARCEAREMPEGHREYQRTATFTQATVPAALRSRHTTKPGVWARIHVVSGALRYRLFAPFDLVEELAPGAAGVVLPEVEHRVEIVGPVEFFVAFYARPGPASW
jgi:tellurite methyltransferase